MSKRYVLVLEQSSEDLQMLRSLLERLSCAMVVTNSADQIVLTAREETPCLVILGGNQQSWSHGLISTLRDLAKTSMIVALTDSHAPSWLPQDENPGLDGFLVKPLSGDVLSSLVQSAWARQTCCAER
ncbi:hypothetical protein ACQ4M4_16320 [Leptolyngbya sp. AN02str]|uniref:hypothetical protein n=1 Tax=Leptolyngbya sp. AN02str TaxID=3423363 RepID=UPI003D31153E